MTTARALTAARAVVADAHREAYLATMRALASRLEARGAHCWVFERRDRRGEFVEFVEGRADAVSRDSVGRDAAEAALEADLRALASYDGDRNVTWDAVALASARS